jgi:hypothetical protein
MKPLPPDTSVETYDFPVFEVPEESSSASPELPPAEGFTPLDPNDPTPKGLETKPIVQTAVFQDFSKVVPPPKPLG